MTLSEMTRTILHADLRQQAIHHHRKGVDMDLFMTGIGLLFVLPVWRYIVKRTLLDTHRDRLFDLRDNLRDTFHTNGWDMGSPLYKHLRDLINGYLRYTERFQYAEFRYIENGIKKDSKLQTEMKSRFEKHFSGITSEQMRYVMKLRAESRRVMMSHMVFSSFPLAMLTILLFPFVGIYTLTCEFINAINTRGSPILRSAVEMHGLLSAFIKRVIAKIAKLVLVEELVEEYSYREANKMRAGG